MSAAFGSKLSSFTRRAAQCAAVAVASAIASTALAVVTTYTYTVPGGGQPLIYDTFPSVIGTGQVGSTPGTGPAILTGFSYSGLTCNTTGSTWPSDLRIGVGASTTGPAGALNDIIGILPFPENAAGPGGPVSNSFTGLESNSWYLPNDNLVRFYAYSTFNGGPASLTGGTISATFDTALPPPPTPPIATPANLGGSLSGPLAAGQIDWYSFNYSGTGALSFDTEGSTLGPNNDTELGVYNSAGILVGTDDDSGTGFLSLLQFSSGALAAGQYYLAIGGFNTTYGSGFAVTSTSTETGTYILHGLNVVPEPGSFAVIGIGALAVVRRRRSA